MTSSTTAEDHPIPCVCYTQMNAGASNGIISCLLVQGVPSQLILFRHMASRCCLHVYGTASPSALGYSQHASPKQHPEDSPLHHRNPLTHARAHGQARVYLVHQPLHELQPLRNMAIINRQFVLQTLQATPTAADPCKNIVCKPSPSRRPAGRPAKADDC